MKPQTSLLCYDLGSVFWRRVLPDERADNFHRFLDLLDKDPGQSPVVYQRLYRRLLIFFESRSGSVHQAEQLADITVDRIVEKVSDPEFLPQDLQTYTLGVARFVLKEHFRKPQFGSLDFEPADNRLR